MPEWLLTHWRVALQAAGVGLAATVAFLVALLILAAAASALMGDGGSSYSGDAPGVGTMLRIFGSAVFFLLGGGYAVDASTVDLWLVSGLFADFGFIPLPAALVGPVAGAFVSVRMLRSRPASPLERRIYPIKAGVAAAVALGLLAAVIGKVRTDVEGIPVSFGSQPGRVFLYCLFAFALSSLLLLNVDRDRMRRVAVKVSGRDAALLDAVTTYGLALAVATVLGFGWWLLSDLSVESITAAVFTLLLVSVTLASSAVAFAGFGSIEVNSWEASGSLSLFSDGVSAWLFLAPLALAACAALVGYRRSRFSRPASFGEIGRGAALQAAMFAMAALVASVVTRLSLSADSWGGEYDVSESIEVAFSPISVVLGSFVVSFLGFAAGALLWAQAAGLVSMPKVGVASSAGRSPVATSPHDAPIATASGIVWVCTGCGSTVGPGDRFCMACGEQRHRPTRAD